MRILTLGLLICASNGFPYNDFTDTGPTYDIGSNFPDFGSIHSSDANTGPDDVASYLPSGYNYDGAKSKDLYDDKHDEKYDDNGYKSNGIIDDKNLHGSTLNNPQPSPYNHVVHGTKCKTEMIFDFNDPKKPFQERYNRIYAQSVGKVVPVEGAVRFDGLGHIEIPYFNQNDLRPAYFMSIVLKPLYFGEPQAILSNSLRMEYATLTLSLHGNRVTLTVFERHEGKVGYHTKGSAKIIQLHVTIPKDKWTRINIEQDDKKIYLSAGDQYDKGYGRLPGVTHEPLYLGAGSSAVATLSPFIGLVDEFVFDKCPVGSY